MFVCEAIEPKEGTFNTAGMAGGEPGLPMAFGWRGREFRVAGILKTWKETGPCRNGSDEMYVRKHWFEIRAESGETMKLYFDRQPKPGQMMKRWWLITVEENS